jgi:hypothetical protein
MARGKKRELSYFRAALLRFLKEYHPLIAMNLQLVEMRAQAAEDLFYKLVHEGKDQHTAHSMALEELYTGLEFSLYYLVYDIICQDKTIPANKRRALSANLLPVCDPVLEKYADTDFYEDEFGFRMMETEVKETIIQYVKTHGIQ